jgi:septum formation protein
MTIAFRGASLHRSARKQTRHDKIFSLLCQNVKPTQRTRLARVGKRLRMLILASTSAYRRELLARLHLEFETFAPRIDEAPLPDESPETTALRLAAAKARSAAAAFPTGVIIGSDQVAELDGLRLGKPGNREHALEQLSRASGREVVFHTAVSVLQAQIGRAQERVVPTRVRFRRLTSSQISAYLDREQPYDCAGSAKSEGLGIALLEQIRGEDPTALVGLPLIALVSLLNEAGLHVL